MTITPDEAIARLTASYRVTLDDYAKNLWVRELAALDQRVLDEVTDNVIRHERRMPNIATFIAYYRPIQERVVQENGRGEVRRKVICTDCTSGDHDHCLYPFKDGCVTWECACALADHEHPKCKPQRLADERPEWLNYGKAIGQRNIRRGIAEMAKAKSIPDVAVITPIPVEEDIDEF